ncbi:MAG TPA: 2'-5' RNA ligase family protein, partial [Desulfuromonadales bacterium]|nr:2'-5' RNA ligase family protein [Desulfuromonadales bacterium]
MVRAFLAIPGDAVLSETVRRLQDGLAGALPRVRWVRPDQVHLTLRFFGDIPEETLEKIGTVMLSIGRL